MLPKNGLPSFLHGLEYNVIFELRQALRFQRREASSYLREDQDVDVPFLHVVAEQGDGWCHFLFVQNDAPHVQCSNAETILARLLHGRGRVVVIGVLSDDLQEVVGDVQVVQVLQVPVSRHAEFRLLRADMLVVVQQLLRVATGIAFLCPIKSRQLVRDGVDIELR